MVPTSGGDSSSLDHRDLVQREGELQRAAAMGGVGSGEADSGMRETEGERKLVAFLSLPPIYFSQSAGPRVFPPQPPNERTTKM